MRVIGKMVIANISLPPELCNMADAWAQKEMRSRSDFFREALRHYIRFLEDEYDKKRA